jgi:hypothetical protein
MMWCSRFIRLVPALTLFPAIFAVAETAHERKRAETLSGEIVFEETTNEDKNYKDVARQAASSWIDQVLASVSVSPAKPVAAISRDAAFYMSALYLYCMNKQGLCPAVLETVLESDIISSAQAGTPVCTNSISFWQQWLQQDMENRAKYLLSIGTATKVSLFNKKERSKYIMCKNTVEGLLKLPDSERAARYGANGSATAYVKRVKSLLQDIDAGGIDIFQVIGLQVRSE